jgi:hypothetical protein
MDQSGRWLRFSGWLACSRPPGHPCRYASVTHMYNVQAQVGEPTMKASHLLDACLVLLLFASTSHAQITEWSSGPQALDSLALLSDTRSNPRRPSPAGLGRFEVTPVRDTVILLDTTTGQTWYLVVPESGTGTRPHWEAVPKDGHARTRSARRKSNAAEAQSTGRSKKRPAGSVLDPFPADTDRGKN